MMVMRGAADPVAVFENDDRRVGLGRKIGGDCGCGVLH